MGCVLGWRSRSVERLCHTLPRVSGEKMKFITRIAPSPTGDMHIGTARTAYFNWLAARASGGEFYLRIDDTDQSRNKPEHIKTIIDTMDWLGLDYAGQIYQSKRFGMYKLFAEILMGSNWAEKKDGAIVLKVKYSSVFPKCWTDETIGDVAITDDDITNMDGMVIIKSDGSPSYNFCSIVDDMETRVL